MGEYNYADYVLQCRQALTAWLATSDPAKRFAIYSAILRREATDEPYVPVFTKNLRGRPVHEVFVARLQPVLHERRVPTGHQVGGIVWRGRAASATTERGRASRLGYRSSPSGRPC